MYFILPIIFSVKSKWYWAFQHCYILLANFKKDHFSVERFVDDSKDCWKAKRFITKNRPEIFICLFFPHCLTCMHIKSRAYLKQKCSMKSFHFVSLVKNKTLIRHCSYCCVFIIETTYNWAKKLVLSAFLGRNRCPIVFLLSRSQKSFSSSSNNHILFVSLVALLVCFLHILYH